MFGAIDRWVGKTLFVPLVIRLCQKTGMTQYAVYRYGWMVAIMLLLSQVSQNPSWSFWSIVILIFFILLGMVNVALAALVPDRPVKSMDWFRYMVIFFTMTDIARGLLFVAGQTKVELTWFSYAYDLTVLFAEYAATITTIPPLEDKKTEASGKVAYENS